MRAELTPYYYSPVTDTKDFKSQADIQYGSYSTAPTHRVRVDMEVVASMTNIPIVAVGTLGFVRISQNTISLHTLPSADGDAGVLDGISLADRIVVAGNSSFVVDENTISTSSLAVMPLPAAPKFILSQAFGISFHLVEVATACCDTPATRAMKVSSVMYNNSLSSSNGFLNEVLGAVSKTLIAVDESSIAVKGNNIFLNNSAAAAVRVMSGAWVANASEFKVSENIITVDGYQGTVHHLSAVVMGGELVNVYGAIASYYAHYAFRNSIITIQSNKLTARLEPALIDYTSAECTRLAPLAP